MPVTQDRQNVSMEIAFTLPGDVTVKTIAVIAVMRSSAVSNKFIKTRLGAD